LAFKSLEQIIPQPAFGTPIVQIIDKK
jgi:hypothetical protein